jgi:hypothetical protein
MLSFLRIASVKPGDGILIERHPFVEAFRNQIVENKKPADIGGR